MWILGVVIGAAAPLLALWGRWPRALMWDALALTVPVVALLWPPALLLGLAMPVAMWIDAVRVVRRGRPGRWHVGAAVLLVLAPVAPALAMRAFVFESLRNPSAAMCPTLAQGDHFVVDKLSLRWRAPGRGDVVVLIAPDGRTFVKRVIAVGGDVVAVRDGEVILGGAAVPTRRIGDTTYWNQPEGRSGEPRPGAEVPAIEFAEELGGHDYHVLHSPDPDPDMTDFPRPARSDAPVEVCEDVVARRMEGALPATQDWPAMTSVPGGCRIPDGTVFVMGDNRENSSDSRSWGPVPVDLVYGRVRGIWVPGKSPSGTWSRVGRTD